VKPNIHPDYHPVVYRDQLSGEQFLTRSTATSADTITWRDGRTYPPLLVGISSYSHPYWTGRARAFDAAGQLEKFHRRYGQHAARADRSPQRSDIDQPRARGAR